VTLCHFSDLTINSYNSCVVAYFLNYISILYLLTLRLLVNLIGAGSNVHICSRVLVSSNNMPTTFSQNAYHCMRKASSLAYPTFITLYSPLHATEQIFLFLWQVIISSSTWMQIWSNNYVFEKQIWYAICPSIKPGSKCCILQHCKQVVLQECMVSLCYAATMIIQTIIC